MGWTYLNLPAGQTVKEFFTNEYGYTNEKTGKSSKVLDVARVKLHTAYTNFQKDLRIFSSSSITPNVTQNTGTFIRK